MSCSMFGTNIGQYFAEKAVLFREDFQNIVDLPGRY